jgi:outer membrane immunogenic protein
LAKALWFPSRTGWTVGGGVEWILARQWTVKAEYLHVDLGNRSINVFTSNGGPGTTFAQTMVVNANLTTEIVRVGLNYQFH